MSTSDGIAFLSVSVAVLALIQSWRAGREVSKATREANDLRKRQVDFQERLALIEQSREQAIIIESLQAVFRAKLGETGRGYNRLFIINTGQGTARNVAIMMDGKLLLEHPAFPKGEKETKMIGPESEISYCMAVSFGCEPPYEFTVTWDDDSGQQGQYSTTLTF